MHQAPINSEQFQKLQNSINGMKKMLVDMENYSMIHDGAAEFRLKFASELHKMCRAISSENEDMPRPKPNKIAFEAFCRWLFCYEDASTPVYNHTSSMEDTGESNRFDASQSGPDEEIGTYDDNDDDNDDDDDDDDDQEDDDDDNQEDDDDDDDAQENEPPGRNYFDEEAGEDDKENNSQPLNAKCHEEDTAKIECHMKVRLMNISKCESHSYRLFIDKK